MRSKLIKSAALFHRLPRKEACLWMLLSLLALPLGAWMNGHAGVSRPAEISGVRLADVLDCHDGDTCRLRDTKEHTIYRVRLIGIDAPEIAWNGKPGQAYGEEARRFINDRLRGKRVRAVFYGSDIYRRYLAKLFIESSSDGVADSATDSQDINGELVALGYAFAYRSPQQAPDARYLQLEESARRQKRGLWALRHPPDLPGNFRHPDR